MTSTNTAAATVTVAPGEPDPNRRYHVTWTVTESHEAEMTAEELAEAMGYALDDVDAAVRDSDYGDLDDALFDLEDSNSYAGTTDRSVSDIEPVSDR